MANSVTSTGVALNLLFGILSVISSQAALPASPERLLSFSKILRHNSSLTDNKLGNFTGFKFQVENENVCGNEEIYMLIFVGSNPDHLHFRNMFREALSNISKIHPELKFKMLFPFGALHNQTKQKALQEEIEQYKDIIQGNFFDSYRNVTLRDLMSFRWSWQHCPQAKYAVHLDDDTVLNMADLMDSLNKFCKDLPVFIGCYNINTFLGVFRDGSYGVSKEEFPDNSYPLYCSGKMYVITPLMAYLLDQTALSARQYWMNDAYLTGSLVKRLNLTHIDLHLRNSSIINDHMNMSHANKSRSLFLYFRKRK